MRVRYDSRKRYIKWVSGSLNVIITTPHGGHLKPTSIPGREDGCYVNGACVFEHGCGVQDPEKCHAKGKADRPSVLREPNSLGYYLNAENYRAVSSPGLPKSGDNPYYADGYKVKTHGSLNGGLIDSILIDIPAEVRSSAGQRRRYAAAVARTLRHYINDHY